MSIATELWFKNLHENKPSRAKKKLNEVTRSGAEATFQYMADNGTRIQTEFDELFDGKMRIALPLVGTDVKNLIMIVNALKTEGWHPPYVNSGPAVAFPTKVVAQKKRRLGGEEYYDELRVASLEIERTYDFTIPAGPRKGEAIEKTDKTTMSRAIRKLVKQGKIDRELLHWWEQKQTFFTKDEESYNDIENMFEGQHEGDKWKLLISRHPVDVLRMSDIGDIRSCHSEGSDYFQCAVQESIGNGLIAYLVKTEDLEEFVRFDPHMRQALALVKRTLEYKPRFDTIHKNLNDAENLAMVLEILKTDWNNPTRQGANRVPPEAIELVTIDMLRDAVHAKLENKPWPGLDDVPPKPLEDFDQQEIFRDRDRNIPGITAGSRLRLRKFFDTANGDWFTVPEDRIYGRADTRFKTAAREWAWEQQKHLFVEDGADEMELPRSEYLQRYGGSYEDTSDGYLLNKFFSMSGTHVEQYRGDVEHIYDEEGENAFDQMEEELQEVLNAVQNRAEHVHFHAEVSHDYEEPMVHGGADVEFSFDIEWEGAVHPGMRQDNYTWPDEERDYATIPKPWGGDWAERNGFQKILDDALGEYSDDTEWEVSSDTIDVRFRFSFEHTTPDDYDSFAETLLDDVDDSYDEKFERIRRALVEENYLPPNDFDRLIDDIKEQSKELTNWDVIGIDEDDDYDGEIWFTFAPEPVPGTLIPMTQLPPALGNTVHALAQVFGNSGTVERRQVNPGVAFYNEMSRNLKALEDAANGYAEEQLEFDFGEKYNRPTYEGIDFGTAQVRLDLDATGLVSFHMKVRVEAADSEEEIEGAFKFMQFIDQYPEQVIKGVSDTFEAFVQNKLEHLKAKEEVYLKSIMRVPLRYKLDSKFGTQADGGDEGAEQAILVAMWVRDNWSQFRKPEKYTAIDQYLRPLVIGSKRPYGSWDNAAETPDLWNGAVRAKMREMKIPNANNYEWGGDWRPAPGIPAQLQNRMGMSPEESHEAENTLQGLSDEERSNAMDALVRGDREEFVRIIRGSVNESLRTTTRKHGFVGKAPAPSQRRHLPATPAPRDVYVDILTNTFSAKEMKDILAMQGYNPNGERREHFIPQIEWTEEGGWKHLTPAGLEFLYDKLLLKRPDPESIEEQINRIDQMLTEREPIDLRIYKVALGCVVDTTIAGLDSQIENQIRGIEEVTTVRNRVEMERNVGASALYRVYEVKFELYGQQARDTYRDSVLVPAIEKEVTGVTVRDRGMPELADSPLREWGGLGYSAPPYDHYLPTMPTPAVGLQSVLEDWAEGGVQVYDTPMNTNQMQYHVMMAVEDIWQYCRRYYRGTKTDFDGRYRHFIKDGPQMPVYIALGQNGRAKITGNEDLIWFAKRAGLEELPVFFSYQKQV